MGKRDGFSEYVEWAKKAKPRIDYGDFVREWGYAGRLIDDIVSGRIHRDKFLSECYKSANRIRRPERDWYTESSSELYDALLEYTSNKRYAKDETDHECEHAYQFSRFVSGSGKRISGTVFLVRVCSDGKIIPFAAPYIKRMFRSPISCAQDGILEQMTEQDIIDYFLYLRRVVDDRSEGDSLILGG